jgi:hypothetical protein
MLLFFIPVLGLLTFRYIYSSIKAFSLLEKLLLAKILIGVFGKLRKIEELEL